MRSRSGLRDRSVDITVAVVDAVGCGVGSLYNTILGNNVPIFNARFPLASRREPIVNQLFTRDIHFVTQVGQSGASPSSNISIHSVVYS